MDLFPHRDLGQKFVVKTFLLEQKNKLSEKYTFPSSIEKAELHMKAARVQSNFSVDSLGVDCKKCPCCNMRINDFAFSVTHTRTTPIFEDQKCYVTSSVSLFFTFIKVMIMMLVIRLILVDVFNIITSLTDQQFCYQKCSLQFWSLSSLIRKYNKKNLIEITNILSLITVSLLLIYFAMIRKLQYTIYCNIDQENQTEDDFTLFVQNIPILNFPSNITGTSKELKFHYERDLIRIFQGEIESWLERAQWENCDFGSLEKDYRDFRESQGDNYDRIPQNIIEAVSLCYDTSSIDKVRKLRSQLMISYQNEITQHKESQLIQDITNQYDTIPQQIQFLNNLELQISQNYLRKNNAANTTINFCGCAFISFKYQHFRDHILQQYAKDRNYFKLKGKSLKISQAPAPSDVLWENLTVSKESRRQRVFLSFFILTVFLVFAFGMLLGSDRIQQFLLRKLRESKQFQKQNKQGINWAQKSITLAITLITLAINYVLQIFAYGLSSWQKHQTKAQQKFSLISKLLATQFFNTAMIFLAISIIDNEDQTGLLSQQGLVYKISYLLVMSGTVQIFLNLLNFGALIRYISLKIFTWRMKDEEAVPLFQIKLNKKYEYTEFDIAQRYSYYLVQLYTVSFYAYIVPLCVPAVALILFCQYWVDKYNLLKRSSLLYELNYSLSRNILKIAECSVLVFSVGSIYFSYRIFGEVDTTLLVSLGVVLVYLFIVLILPVKYQHKFLQSYQKCEIYSYNQCLSSGKFSQTYWKKNPVTMLSQQKQLPTKFPTNQQHTDTEQKTMKPSKYQKQMDKLTKNRREKIQKNSHINHNNF